MGILCWRDIVDMLWSISEGLHVIHEHNLVHGHLHGGNVLVENEMGSIDTKITDTGLHGPFDKQIPSQHAGTPPVFARLMLQCLDADPLNRPTTSQLCEYLGNWTAICDDSDPSDLSNQFDVAEETKFANLDKLKFNNTPCHENAIYFSRPLDSIINNESSSTPFFYGKM
ncbi:unnamed protein product [Rhizophagus irregularis]|nr:unnamed protein product [Rhizophagus irregularis]